MSFPLPVYKKNGEIAFTVTFEDNLTLPRVPLYVNEGGRLGIKRVTREESEEFNGRLVYMYIDCFHPYNSQAWIISEEEAYERCINRGRKSVIEKYDICPYYPRG